MTTGNKQWAIGRAVERALRDSGRYVVYRNDNDDYAVRASEAAPPRNFERYGEAFWAGFSASQGVTFNWFGLKED